MNFIDGIIVFISVVLILIVLLQSSEDSIEDAFSGEKSELFKNKKVRGIDLLFLRVTTVSSVALVVLVVISNYIHATSL